MKFVLPGWLIIISSLEEWTGEPVMEFVMSLEADSLS
jgi:hypothetical protein